MYGKVQIWRYVAFFQISFGVYQPVTTLYFASACGRERQPAANGRTMRRLVTVSALVQGLM